MDKATETIYAIAGRVLSKNERVTSSQSLTELFIIFGAVGLLVTLAYDLITNAIFGCLFLGSVWAGLLTMNFPLPMGLIHEASNLILFALVVPLLIQAIKRYLLK